MGTKLSKRGDKKNISGIEPENFYSDAKCDSNFKHNPFDGVSVLVRNMNKMSFFLKKSPRTEGYARLARLEVPSNSARASTFISYRRELNSVVIKIVPNINQ